MEGDRIFPASVPNLKNGTYVYRNYDHEFEKILSKKSAERKIGIDIELNEISFGFSLTATDEDGNSAALNFEYEKQLAQKDQSDNIRNNLGKTGNTIFAVQSVNIDFSSPWFIPASVLSEWRRQMTDKLLSLRKINYCQEIVKHQQTNHPFPENEITYLGNVMNEKSRRFYNQHQAQVVQPAYEKQEQKDVPLMFTRHCI